MEHDVWIAIISGLTATAVPTVGILIVWLQDKAQFTSINQRFDDMRELWRAELRRFEEGLDARLKRLEEDEREHEANLPHPSRGRRLPFRVNRRISSAVCFQLGGISRRRGTDFVPLQPGASGG